MLLVIGNKNYSSWSLRSWIALKMLGVPVDRKRIALRRPGDEGRDPALFVRRARADPARRRHGGVGLARHPRVPGREASAALAERPGAARKGAFSGRRSPRSSGKGRMPNHVSAMSAFGRLRTLELLAHGQDMLA